MGTDHQESRRVRRLILAHLRVLPVAEVAQVAGEIVGTEEDAVDAFGRGDRIEIGHRLACFHLQR
jgi:hypothetical protein